VGQKDSSPGSAGFVQRTPSEQRIRLVRQKKPIADLSFLLLFVSRQKEEETLLVAEALKLGSALICVCDFDQRVVL
jgi:hypothetical protein